MLVLYIIFYLICTVKKFDLYYKNVDTNLIDIPVL